MWTLWICDVPLSGVCDSIKNPVSKELLYETIERHRWTPNSKRTAATATANSSNPAVGDSQLMPPPAKIPKRWRRSFLELLLPWCCWCRNIPWVDFCISTLGNWTVKAFWNPCDSGRSLSDDCFFCRTLYVPCLNWMLFKLWISFGGNWHYRWWFLLSCLWLLPCICLTYIYCLTVQIVQKIYLIFCVFVFNCVRFWNVLKANLCGIGQFVYL